MCPCSRNNGGETSSAFWELLQWIRHAVQCCSKTISPAGWRREHRLIFLDGYDAVEIFNPGQIENLDVKRERTGKENLRQREKLEKQETYWDVKFPRIRHQNNTGLEGIYSFLCWCWADALLHSYTLVLRNIPIMVAHADVRDTFLLMREVCTALQFPLKVYLVPTFCLSVLLVRLLALRLLCAKTMITFWNLTHMQYCMPSALVLYVWCYTIHLAVYALCRMCLWQPLWKLFLSWHKARGLMLYWSASGERVQC